MRSIRDLVLIMAYRYSTVTHVHLMELEFVGSIGRRIYVNADDL